MVSEKQIKLLPDHIANKIAAGEVVDRPASVLKELVENALDAGATQIDVEIIAGGKKSVIVSDNGSGMSRDNALLCIERHATSKILDADDIEKVRTLGFRGEALAAISSVSRFTLATRRAEDEHGTEIVISGGKLQDVRDVGGPSGSRVSVRNLFFNIPARRKFLRTEQTELSHVRQSFLVYAMSHPETGFSLTVDGREAYRLAGGATIEDRLRELLGSDSFHLLRPVHWADGKIEIKGYVSLPQNSRADRTEQFIFINGRPASAAVLNYAVGEAYHTLLPRGRYPILYIYIRMQPEQVDVNVHPAKKEVRFRRPGEIRDTLIEALRNALEQLSSASLDVPLQSVPPVPPVTAPLLAIENMPQARTFSYPKLPMVPSSGTVSGNGREGDKNEVSSGGKEVSEAPWSWCRILGQVGGLYVIMETEDGLVLMDPHAAHERVLYERYMKEVLGKKVKGQGLLTPESVELGPEDAQCVRDHLDTLKRMGFGISEFGGDTFIVDALPVCLGNASAGSLLAEVAGGLGRGGKRGGTERWAEENVAQAACKAAVKARDHLRLDEIEQLVIDLARAEMPYTCPHGRPTIIFMGYNELHKKFGRT